MAVLSTSCNGTYISTSASGSQDEPCPPSYIYDATYNTTNYLNNNYTFSSSMVCHGYYDLTTSTAIPFETASNYTGSAEDISISTEIQDADVKYAVLGGELILPETYQDNGPITSNAFYSMGDQIYGFADNHEDQALGLGLNSTFLNAMYNRGTIASKSVGLHYGVPASSGHDLEINRSIIVAIVT